MAVPPDNLPPLSPALAVWRRAWARLDVREGLWWVLDRWEERAGLRRTVYFALGLILGGAGLAAWGYPRWAQYRAQRIAT
ncbi:MAG: hypothetical protein NTU80_04685 [Verrucomicrobia bacterium]|nr:hypothetical protein [Verrucomicrobiota bacterium]